MNRCAVHSRIAVIDLIYRYTIYTLLFVQDVLSMEGKRENLLMKAKVMIIISFLLYFIEKGTVDKGL